MNETVLTVIKAISVFLAASGLLFGIASFFIVAHVLFTMHLKRTDKEKWKRACSADDPTQMEMYSEGLIWQKQYDDRRKDLHIVNDGLNLYGEFYDLGSKKAVIIIPGRTESLHYSYFFAKPYTDSGWSVLAIDQRAHGLSDGKYNTVGFEEHRDILAWGKLLNEKYGIETIVLHGICIGASCGLFALTSDGCPDYFGGLVAEGMYPNFRESFKNHMIELKKPVHPVLELVDMWMRLYTGHTMKNGPIDVIDRYRGPLLMLHSNADLYSKMDTAEELYEKCASNNKHLVRFDDAKHSHIRHMHREAYDRAVTDFLQTL